MAIKSITNNAINIIPQSKYLKQQFNGRKSYELDHKTRIRWRRVCPLLFIGVFLYTNFRFCTVIYTIPITVIIEHRIINDIPQPLLIFKYALTMYLSNNGCHLSVSSREKYAVANIRNTNRII